MPIIFRIWPACRPTCSPSSSSPPTGEVFSAGDINYAFSIQSCSKVFTLAQVMQESGEEAVLEKIGVEPTGMPFNSVTALGMHNNKAVNPLVNAGAMAAVSMVKASSAEERWDKILAYQSKFAGEPLKLIDEVYKSEADTNFRNRGIAWILYNNGNLFCDPPEATDVYTKQCSIGVTAKQLAVMGATLANGGVNPDHQGTVPRIKVCPARARGDDDGGLLR